MNPVFNFSAGPATLPATVMARAQAEFVDWHGRGMSVLELSHRSKDYLGVAQQAEADLRELMGISDDYHVLFLQGGATAQFAMVPMNLIGSTGKADYFDTGAWSVKAIAEAGRFGDVQVVASSRDSHYDHVPTPDTWRLRDDAAYVHYTPNETIGGLEFAFVPEVGDRPLVADMSSTILSRPTDVSRFGLIYAGAQKNIGPAGLTVVIVRKDLVGHSLEGGPSLFDYAAQAHANSMLNTPPTFAWYLAGLVLEWLKAQGGLTAMAQHNEAKAGLLYTAIDRSDFYASPIAVVADRSWMNVPFTLADSALDADFLAGAEAAGLMNLKGHRSVGGMRASIYNAMPMAGVEALVAYMAEFERTHG